LLKINRKIIIEGIRLNNANIQKVFLLFLKKLFMCIQSLRPLILPILNTFFNL